MSLSTGLFVVMKTSTFSVVLQMLSHCACKQFGTLNVMGCAEPIFGLWLNTNIYDCVLSAAIPSEPPIKRVRTQWQL